MSLETMFADMKLPAAPAEGSWRAIQLCPNPTADERLNVGVVYVAEGKAHYRLIENMAGLKCLYGAEALENAQFLLALVRDALDAGGALTSPAPQILLGPEQFATGDKPEAVVDRIFSDVVTIGRHRMDLEAVAIEEAPTVRNSTVRKKVVAEILRVAPAVVKKVVAEKPFKVRSADNVEHELDIPLRAPGHFGSIVSAAYRSSGPRRTGLYAAFMDLSTARQFVEKREDGRLFILRDEGFPESLQRDIDNDIDDIGWRLRKINIEISPGFSPAAIAKDIVTWSKR